MNKDTKTTKCSGDRWCKDIQPGPPPTSSGGGPESNFIFAWATWNQTTPILLLLMAEILHHLRWLKPYK